jgi:hypothetical protein
MQSNWDLVKSNFQRLTSGTYIDDGDLSDISDSNKRISNNADIRQTISRLSKSMTTTRDAKSIAAELFESKIQNLHFKRQAKVKSTLNRQIDILDRKLNEVTKQKAEKTRLISYNSLLQIELKRNVAKPNLLNFKNEKEMQRLVGEIEDLDQKLEKLGQQREQNEECLEEIKDFYKVVTKALKDHVPSFKEVFVKIEQNGGKDFGQSCVMTLTRDFLTRSLYRTKNDDPKFESESVLSDINDKKQFLKSQKIPRQVVVSARDKTTSESEESSKRTFSQSFSTINEEPENVVGSLKKFKKLVKTNLNKPEVIDPSYKDSKIELLKVSKKSERAPSARNPIAPKINPEKRKSEPFSQANHFLKKKLPGKEITIVNDSNIQKEGSVTSSIGSSVYNEIMEGVEFDQEIKDSQRFISDKNIVFPPQAQTKRKFIPVKISFKIGPDKLPGNLTINSCGERIYKDYLFKKLTFFLSTGNQICGLQFTFYNVSKRANHEGKLHGKKGPKSKVMQFTNGEFLSMAHFHNSQDGLEWIKIFTNVNACDVGVEKTGEKPSGVRYFPREVKLCKFFTCFSKKTGVLAQMRFIYIRTVFY